MTFGKFLGDPTALLNTDYEKKFTFQVLNWYRIRELEMGLSSDLFEFEPRFEEIDGLDSEHNQLVNRRL